MNNHRRRIMLIGAGALVVPLELFAQQSGKVWRVAYLDLGSRQSLVDSGWHSALVEGLRTRNYVDGRNLRFEEHYAEGSVARLDELATGIVGRKVDLIIAYGAIAAHALKRTTTTIPIVITATADPVGNGFATSLARPGGNITGMTGGAEDTNQKMVELLRVAAPPLRRIAVFTNPANKSHASLLLSVQSAGRQFGIQVIQINVGTPDDLDRGFATVLRERIDGAIVFADAFFFSQRARIASLALKSKIPSIYGSGGYADAGGLMSYGADNTDNFRRTGIFVDKILKGATPGEIPFEQPTRYYFVINRRTAAALGITFSAEVLARVDKVIE